jgi:hypothetical protein
LDGKYYLKEIKISKYIFIIISGMKIYKTKKTVIELSDLILSKKKPPIILSLDSDFEELITPFKLSNCITHGSIVLGVNNENSTIFAYNLD